MTICIILMNVFVIFAVSRLIALRKIDAPKTDILSLTDVAKLS